ncbi:dystroglycan-like [Dorcoceras hygrometricum]|uniref:Dystroglycan-like n=1 Tax=Dorcoceras hygrometricum TaxID=472368 RepID=A0A2Z7AMT0_9LAMI|nr:dystroglycan-like [Dorcoceras hygrometricum]
MASAYYSNTVHIDFASVLAMENPGIVSVLNAMMASGLEGFLGCPTVIYESELVDFFNNGSVWDGLVVSTVNGVPVEISEQLFAETFELPVDGLADLSDMPKDKIFDARSIVSLTGEPVSLSGRKGQMKIEYRLLCDIMAKAISVKAGSFNALTVEKFSLLTAVVAAEIDASADRDKPADTTEERQWFDLSHEELIAKWAAERLVTTPDDTDEEIEAERPVFASVEAVAPVVEVCEAAADKDFLLFDDPDTVINQVLHQLDSISADKDDKSSDRAETWFDRALDEMLRNDEGAEAMDVGTTGGDQQVQFSEEEPVEKSVDEFIDADEARSLEDIISSIPVDVPLPSVGMEISKIVFGQTIYIPGVNEGDWYKAKLPKIHPEEKGKEPLQLKDPAKGRPHKEHYSLICANIDLFVDLRAKNNFVPGQGSSAVDLRVIDLLSHLHVFVLEELTKEARARGLSWKKTCCSKIFEVSPRDRGAVIARTNTTTRSSCWIRTMKRVNGTWVIEPCADQWVKIPRPIISNEVPSQRKYDDTLPLMSEFFKLLKKRWADICLEVVGFWASRRLLPVGSLHFCRSLSVIEPIFRVAPRQSPVFSFRVSQFCSVFIDYSLFSWLPTVDITDFLSSIALDRTVFRSEQIAQNTVSVTPSVQMLDEPSSSDSSSHDISMDFADTAAAAPTPDITDALNQLRASIDQIYERDDGAKLRDILSLHLSKFENKVIARLDAQDKVLGALRRDSTDHRNLLSLELRSSHKQLSTGIVTIGLDVVDIRRVVKETHQELIAKINSLDEQVAATRNDFLEFSAQSQQSLNVLTTQLNELVAYINRGGDNKKGESSSRGPHSQSQPPPPPASTPGLEQRIEMAQRNILERVMDTDRREVY